MKAHINADGFEQKKSANQLYKESGSTMSFKSWLQDQQDKGYLKADGTNANGDTPDQVAYDLKTYGYTGAAPAANTTTAPPAKKKANVDDVLGFIGKAAESGEKIFGLGTSIAGAVKQAKADKNASKLDGDLSRIGKGGHKPPSESDNNNKALGVPSVVWYGVATIGVVLVGYYVYKNFVATGDGTSAPATA